MVVLTTSIVPVTNHWFFADEFSYRSGVFRKDYRKTSDSQIKIEVSENENTRIQPRLVEVDGHRFEFYSRVTHSSYAGLFDLPESVIATNDAEKYAYYYLKHLKSDFRFTVGIVFFIALFPPLSLFLIGITNKRV